LATAKWKDADLADRASDTFRLYGYEGTSLSRLAEATGLEKASLYYRFPGGKDEMLMAGVARVGEWFEENVVQPLAGAGSLEIRVDSVVDRLREFYGDGTKPCVLDTLSLRSNDPKTNAQLQTALRGALERWLQAFAGVAIEAGLNPEQAKARAERAVIEIEGALILSRVLGDGTLFRRTVGELYPLLTAG
jgi:AcrR family transcriptional regulator